MNIRETNWIARLAIGMALVFGATDHSNAQMTLIDDFDDGNDQGWSRYDGMSPMTGGPGIFDASSGAYNLKSTELVPVGVFHYVVSLRQDTVAPMFSNGFMRGKIRVDAEGTIGYLLMRTDSVRETGYLFSADTATNRFAIEQIGVGVLARLDGPNDPTFNVGDEWNIEGGAVGDQLTLKAWQVGELEPSVPQLQITNSDLSTGRLGVGANVSALPFWEPAFVDATFDDIYFTSIPEPSAAALSLLGALGLLTWRRPRCLSQRRFRCS